MMKKGDIEKNKERGTLFGFLAWGWTSEYYYDRLQVPAGSGLDLLLLGDGCALAVRETWAAAKALAYEVIWLASLVFCYGYIPLFSYSI